MRFLGALILPLIGLNYLVAFNANKLLIGFISGINNFKCNFYWLGFCCTLIFGSAQSCQVRQMCATTWGIFHVFST